MNEVDRLYNEWREEQCSQATIMCRYCKDVYQKWCVHVPEYIKAGVVLETSKALNEFIENNKNDLCDDEIKMRIKYAEEELEKRANKHSEFAASVRKKQLETREKTALEQVHEAGCAQDTQNEFGDLYDKMMKRNEQRTKTKKRIKKLKEEETTMATTSKNIKVNTKIDVAALVQAKMAEKMMDTIGDGKDIPLTKLAIMQSLANGGSIDVTELIRAKQTEKLLKELNENKDLSIGKLLTYQALTSEGGFDVNALIQAQFVEKLFADDEKTK